jgi:hypothetical protein
VNGLMFLICFPCLNKDGQDIQDNSSSESCPLFILPILLILVS